MIHSWRGCTIGNPSLLFPSLPRAGFSFHVLTVITWPSTVIIPEPRHLSIYTYIFRRAGAVRYIDNPGRASDFQGRRQSAKAAFHPVPINSRLGMPTVESALDAEKSLPYTVYMRERPWATTDRVRAVLPAGRNGLCIGLYVAAAYRAACTDVRRAGKTRPGARAVKFVFPSLF